VAATPEAEKTYRRADSSAGEAKLLVRLALPVAIAQVGAMSMGLVDTFMVGRLGAVELAAVALGDACFFTLQVLAMGVIMALGPLVSQAHGAGDPQRCAAAWRTGLRLALVMTLPLVALVFAIGPALRWIGGIDPRVVQTSMDYLAPRTLGVLPHLIYVACRALLNGKGDTRPAMVVTLIAVVMNAFLDWVFIFGNLGAPALGVAGSGLVTALCRGFMCIGLLVWLKRPAYRAYTKGAQVSRALFVKVFRLGVPIGLTHALEVGAFAASSIYMGWIGVTALAAHQIALKMATASFMLAISLGIATGIRVGNGIGASEPDAAQRSAWVGIGIGLMCMAINGLIFVVFRRELVGAFTPDAAVVELGATLLLVAAVFQLSDGTQAICAGALRGAGRTVQPMIAQLCAHWVIALPLGYLLAFTLGWGPLGVWCPLVVGLSVAAGLLLFWVRKIRFTQPV
jgi:multidrug resistance protein, MATE family